MTKRAPQPIRQKFINDRNDLTALAGPLPPLIERAGEQSSRRFLEFFTAHIRNRGTRAAYARVVARFLDWCDIRGVELSTISPLVVAAYIEQLTLCRSAPTVKLHLRAIRMLFDFLVVGQVVPLNPTASVRGPKHVVKKGKTPVLTAGKLVSCWMGLIRGLSPGFEIGH